MDISVKGESGTCIEDKNLQPTEVQKRQYVTEEMDELDTFGLQNIILSPK